jgi:hypothetical protein
MTLMRAFSKMLGDVTAKDASARQVNGILAWREYALRAVTAGQGLPCSPGRSVLITDSSTHREWKAAVGAILDDLAEQANDADTLHEEKKAEAEDWDQVAVKAQREAAACEQAAAAEEAAAAACAPDDDGAAEAAAHYAAAARYREAAAAATARAVEARRRAALAREIAEKAMAWGVAARDALTFGTRLIAGEDVIAIPVGEAIAAAGGLPEVYGDKHALTMDGSGRRPLAIRGGAR